jgi:threonine dehydrogenase-like Zn-dependent dehydrogenase
MQKKSGTAEEKKRRGEEEQRNSQVQFSASDSFHFSPSSYAVGTRVASNGPHAECVCVPENLCAIIPDNVSDDEGAFTVVGAIALQGVRLCNSTFGETVVV